MVNAGRILIMPKGEWDTLVSYNMLDLVTYSGVAYLAKQASTGVNPKTDPNKDAYWQVFGTSVVPDNDTIIFDGNNNLAVNIDGTTIQYDSGTNFVKVAIDGVSLKYDSTNGYIYADVVSSLAGLSDVNLTNIRNGQIIAYNSASQKFVNIDLPVGGGSKIKVTTSETTLYGKTVTLSDGTHTLTGTFSNSGEYTFEGVEYTGNLVITSSDGTDTATRYLTVPYYSSYSVGLTFFEATVTVTYPEDLGATCNISDGVTTIAATGSPMAFIVPNAGTWTATVTLDGADKTGSVTIGASGESKSITITFGTINVTYSDDFKGVSITCVNGGTTITKTAPSAGNAMSFFPPTTGNWTISGTVSSDTFYSTPNPVVVSSLSTSVGATLETIPDGSTKTPTDDVSIWLSCAGIRDKSYTTLTEVLADSETFNALLGDSNACAYMARSTTWAGDSNGKVPTMTSNTTPSGVVTSSTSGNNDYKTFASSNNLLAQVAGWYVSGGTYNNSYIQYEFPQAVTLSRVDFAFPTTNNRSIDHVIKIQGSNNGSDWEDLANSSPTSSSIVYSIPFTKTASYKYVRFVVVSGTGSGATDNGYHIQYYCDGVTTSKYAMSMIGQYDVCCDALLGNATWASAICASTYVDYILSYGRGLVPVMTSDTTPSGTVIKNGSYSGYPAYNAFDGKSSTAWSSDTNTFSSSYIGYKFPSATSVKGCKITPRSGGTTPLVASIKIQGSDDDFVSDIHDITSAFSQTVFSSDDTPSYIPFVSEYQSLRIQFISMESGTAGSYPTIGDIQFYNFDSGEYIHGTNNESAYYLDGATQTPIVDPSTLSAGTYTFGSTVAKEPSDLTADYTKTIRITPNTKEIVLRPDNALYWWGYESSDLVDMYADGWSAGFTGYSITASSKTSYYYQITAPASTMSGIASKRVADSDHTLKAIVDGVTAVTNIYSVIAKFSGKSISTITGQTNNTTSGLSLQSVSVLANYYEGIYAGEGRNSQIYALYKE